MTDLSSMCIDAGFTDVRTYIASGNVIFAAKQPAMQVKSILERRLQSYAGKPVGVVIRTPDEMARVLERNPFRDRPANATVAIFLDGSPPADALEHVRGQRDEELQLGHREIYVFYPSGIGRSKLRIPAAEQGTARNINTIAKLVELAGGDALMNQS